MSVRSRLGRIDATGRHVVEIGLLVVIALVIAAAVAYRQMNDGGDNNSL